MARYRDENYARQRGNYDYDREDERSGYYNNREGYSEPYGRKDVEYGRGMVREGVFYLSDTNLVFQRDKEDIRGQRVIDKNGKEIGTVDDLLVEEKSGRVRFVQITSGGFLGLGATKFLVPAESVSYQNNGDVLIDDSKHGGAAAGYNPQLIEDRDTDDRSYWGWGASYIPFGGYAPWSDLSGRPQVDERYTGEPYRGRAPRNYRRSDARISEDVCERLADDPFLDASDIEVSVNESDVILSGTVNNRNDKRRAEDIALSIHGVTNVQNSLRVRQRDVY